MGKSNAFRHATYVKRVVATVPASNTTYAVDLPAGAYRLAVFVKSNLTGTTTTVTARLFADAAQAQTHGLDLRVVEPDDSTPAVSLALPAGAAGRVAEFGFGVNTILQPIVVANGLQITVTKGGATTGETLEIDLVAVSY